MSNSYVIHWKNKVNGRAGKGTKEFDSEEANRLAEELNREYPAIHHWIMEAHSQAPPEGQEAGTDEQAADGTEPRAENQRAEPVLVEG